MCMEPGCVSLPTNIKPEHVLLWTTIASVFVLSTVWRFGHELKVGFSNLFQVAYSKTAGTTASDAGKKE